MPFRVDCLQFSTLVDRCIANYRLGDARAVCKITSVVITTPVFICFFSYFICFEPQGNVTIQRYRTERYCIEIYLIKTTGQCNYTREAWPSPLLRHLRVVHLVTCDVRVQGPRISSTYVGPLALISTMYLDT